MGYQHIQAEAPSVFLNRRQTPSHTKVFKPLVDQNEQTGLQQSAEQTFPHFSVRRVFYSYPSPRGFS